MTPMSIKHVSLVNQTRDPATHISVLAIKLLSLSIKFSLLNTYLLK